jgi:hypothetical protein
MVTIKQSTPAYQYAARDGREFRYDYRRGQWQEMLWPNLWRDVPQEEVINAS